MSDSVASSPFYTEDHDAFREVVRQFAEKEIAPHVHEWDLAGEVPRDLYNKAGAIGFFGDGFDEEFGGFHQEHAVEADEEAPKVKRMAENMPPKLSKGILADGTDLAAAAWLAGEGSVT